MDAEGLEKFFEPFAAVSVKSMFGGRGVYAHGMMIALYAAGEIYLKTDTVSAPHFAKAGSSPFVYPTPTGPRETSYWAMPASAREDPAEIEAWCGAALDAARRRAAEKVGKGAKVKELASRGKAAPAPRGGAPKKTVAKTPARPGKSRAARARL